jgi:stage II sporulation protein GA (sporulation sigma-E factor processing peptidase)
VRVVYADSLFALNFVIDYLVLLTTAKIAGVRVPRLRIVLSAVLGGAYAVSVVVFDMPLLQNIWIKLAAGILMVLVCFWTKSGFLRISLIFLAVSATFGGIVFALSLLCGGASGTVYTPVSWKILIPAFGISYAGITLVFRRMGRRRSAGLINTEIEHGGRKTSVTSLEDTGNTLTDPMTGESVIVAETEAVASLFDKKVADVLREKDDGPIQKLERLSQTGERFRLVPYSSVGVEHGWLLAFKPDEVKLNGKDKTGMLIALSPNRLSDGGIYSAVVGK